MHSDLPVGIEYSDFQLDVLEAPENHDLFLGGGRGGGKSFVLAVLAWKHLAKYAAKGPVLYVRQTYPGIHDFEQICRELYGKALGGKATYNASSHVWRFDNGGYFELGQLESIHDYGKYQGRTFSLLLIDEAGQWSDPQPLDLLRSNLRGPEGVPVRVVMAANPGGAGHHWVAQRYVFGQSPWQPFHEEKSNRDWIYCPSTYLDNKFIKQDDYKSQILAATATDKELGRAYLEGDWTVVRGAYFATVLEEARVAVELWPTPEENFEFWSYARASKFKSRTEGIVLARIGGNDDGGRWNSRKPSNKWDCYLAYDHGSAKPAACLLIAEARDDAQGPDGRYYPKTSRVVIDEYVSNAKDSLNQGLQYPVPTIASKIKKMCDRWRVDPRGVADDAIFSKHGHSSGSIADEFTRCGVHFRPSKNKDRISGWETMRRMFADAGSTDAPGLYIARNCAYLWATLPYLERDARRVEDVNTEGPDHAADSLRYGIAWKRPVATSMHWPMG